MQGRVPHPVAMDDNLYSWVYNFKLGSTITLGFFLCRLTLTMSPWVHCDEYPLLLVVCHFDGVCCWLFLQGCSIYLQTVNAVLSKGLTSESPLPLPNISSVSFLLVFNA